MAASLRNTGIFELKSASDLLAKVRHDLSRLRADPNDTYAAFDFFVTARHIPEWVFPSDPVRQAQLFEKHVELRICRHLADGAKHFEATRGQHKQVASTLKSTGAWGDSWAKGSWAPGGWGDGLFINLDDRDPDTKDLGRRISAVKLAEKVMQIFEAAI